MRLLNEKTVAKLCQTRRTTREGYLLYQRQAHCTLCQQSCRPLRDDRKISTPPRPTRQYFRLCGNLLYCLAADHSFLEDSHKLPECVLILQGHVVQTVEGKQMDGNSNSGDELFQQRPERDGHAPDSTFQIVWPPASLTPDSDASTVSGKCTCCYGATNIYLFTAPSSEEAELWIRALLVASSDCAKFTSEELRDQLQQISEVAEIYPENAPAKDSELVQVAQDPVDSDTDCDQSDRTVGPPRRNPFSFTKNKNNEMF